MKFLKSSEWSRCVAILLMLIFPSCQLNERDCARLIEAKEYSKLGRLVAEGRVNPCVAVQSVQKIDDIRVVEVMFAAFSKNPRVAPLCFLAEPRAYPDRVKVKVIEWLKIHGEAHVKQEVQNMIEKGEL